MFMMELSKSNHLLSLVREEAMSKSAGYVCGGEKSAEDVLIADCMTFGVKVAGTSYGLLYGTGEVDTVLRNRERKQPYKDCMKYRWQTKS